MKLANWKGFAPLRHSRFRLLIAGQLTSRVGDGFYAIALPWYILQVHGGTVLLGTVLAGYGVAQLVTLIPGGWAADRWRPWTIMLVTDGAQAVLTGLLALVAATGRANLPELLPISVLIGAAAGLFSPGAYAIVPALVPDDALQAGNSLLNGTAQLAGLIGPALGGAVVAFVGPAPAFGVDSLSFVVSVLSLAAILVRNPDRNRNTAPAPAEETDAPEKAKTPGLWQLVRRERVLQTLLLIVLVANLGAGTLGVAFPVLARGPFHLDASGYGLLIDCSAAGGLIGVLAAAHFDPGRRPAIRASWLFIAANVFLAIVPYLGGPIGAGFYLFLWAAINTLGNLILMTLIQRWAPPALLGRATSLVILASLGANPIAVALAGPLVRDVGPKPFYPLTAIIDAMVILAALTQTAYRHLGAKLEPIKEPRQTNLTTATKPEHDTRS